MNWLWRLYTARKLRRELRRARVYEEVRLSMQSRRKCAPCGEPLHMCIGCHPS